MSDPILIRGEISSGVAWSRTLVPLGVVLSAVLFWLAPPPIGLILGLVFGTAWMWLEIYVARQRFRQLWVRDSGDGFELIDRQSERHLPDSHTNSVSLKIEGVFSNGIQTGTRRIFTVWSDLEPDPVPLVAKLKQKQADPLAPMINRILETFQQRTQAALAEGAVLDGAGWRLDHSILAWGKGDPKESIARTDVSACEEFDGHICVWRKGHDEAIAKFKVGTRNVCLLPVLLASPSAEGAAARHEDSAGLGRILFERKSSLGTRLTVGILGFFLILFGVAFLAAGVVMGIEPVAMVVGLALILAGISVLVWSYALKFQSFRCHERGVVQVGLRSRKELRYDETGAFTYSATRHYHNGAYVGTSIGLHLTPLAESGSPKISYSTNVKNEDAAIEELRNFISRAIAGRMAKRLAEGQEVPWTPNLTFVSDGIVYRPPGFIGRKDAKQLSYVDYGGWNMEQGVFYLFQKGEKKAVTNEQVSAANFYPGFFLLMLMQGEGSSS
jgi:hypothetical protein